MIFAYNQWLVRICFVSYQRWWWYQIFGVMTLYYSELRVIFTLKLDKEPFRGGTTVMIMDMVNMFICGASSGLNNWIYSSWDDVALFSERLSSCSVTNSKETQHICSEIITTTITSTQTHAHKVWRVFLPCVFLVKVQVDFWWESHLNRGGDSVGEGMELKEITGQAYIS